ncbi:MAG: hypothetical protein ABL890_01490 [Candidatus Peribacteraceae bacterium]
MFTSRVRIGALLIALSAMTGSYGHTAFAAGSTSYTLNSNFGNEATGNGGTSTNYKLTDAAQTWEQKPGTSNTYKLAQVTDQAQTSSSSSSSSSGGGSTGGTGGSGGTGGGHTGGSDRPPYSSSSSSSVSSSIASSVSSSIASSTAESEEDIFAPTPPRIITKSVVGLRTLQFFDALDGGPCTEEVLHGAAPQSPFPWHLLLILVFLFFCIWSCQSCAQKCAYGKVGVKKKNTPKTGKRILSLLIGMTILMTSLNLSTTAYAVQTVPLKNVYNGRLLDSSGNPVTSAVSVRFSYWNDNDHNAGDTDGTGAINTADSSYVGWNEVHTVTPDSGGRFSVSLGSATALPDFSTLPIATLLSLYLQVEVKPSAAANTSYELLDIDPTDASIDRSGVLSVPFAQNADFIDQREIGTGSGNIALVGPGGRFPDSVAPDGTNSGTYVIDADNTETSKVILQFGTTLAEQLYFDIVNSRFNFTDDLRVEGNLTVTGLINGVDITNITGAGDRLKASSGGGLNLNVQGGSYRVNGNTTNYAGGSITLTSAAINYVFFGSGGLTKNTSGFPTDESVIQIAEVTTSVGSISTIADRRVTATDDREHTIVNVMNPSFEKASYQGDGSDNIGQLSVSFDNINKKNFYLWTSTKSTLQDYDMFVKIPLSPDFTRWIASQTENPITLTYRSTSAASANNALAVTIYDTNGVPVSLSGSTSNLANTSWTEQGIEFTGSPTWTAGSDMVIKLTTSAKDNFQIHLGGLKLQYTTLDP